MSIFEQNGRIFKSNGIEVQLVSSAYRLQGKYYERPQNRKWYNLFELTTTTTTTKALFA